MVDCVESLGPRHEVARDDGREVELRDELDDGRPVVLKFIYTSCTGICPLANDDFSELQRELGAERDHVHLVSISIDPEADTPARLREYVPAPPRSRRSMSTDLRQSHHAAVRGTRPA